MYIHVHVHIHIVVHTCTCTYTYSCTYSTCTYTYSCTLVQYIHVYMYMYAYAEPAHIYVHVHVSNACTCILLAKHAPYYNIIITHYLIQNYFDYFAHFLAGVMVQYCILHKCWYAQHSQSIPCITGAVVMINSIP